MPPSTPNAVVGAAPSCRIRVNPKVLRVGGFASEKERLSVQATLTNCRPLEAHLCCSVVKLGMEPKLGKVCNFGTARWRRRGGSCGIPRRARRRGRSRSRCWRAVPRRARPLESTRRVTTPQIPAPTRSRSLWWGRARAPRFPGKPPPNRDSSTAPAVPPAPPRQRRPLGSYAPPSSGSPPSPASRTSGSPLPLSCARPPTTSLSSLPSSLARGATLLPFTPRRTVPRTKRHRPQQSVRVARPPPLGPRALSGSGSNGSITRSAELGLLDLPYTAHETIYQENVLRIRAAERNSFLRCSLEISRRRPAREVKVGVVRHEAYRRRCIDGGRGNSERSRSSLAFSSQNARSSGLSTPTISFIRVTPTTLEDPHAGRENPQVAKHEVAWVLRAGERLLIQKYLATLTRPVELAEREKTLGPVPYSVALKASRNSPTSTGVAPA